MSHGKGRKWPRELIFMICRAAVVFLCGAVIIPELPVNCLSVTDNDGRVILGAPMRTGELFTTEYIHSVQLTPVIDEYAVLQGKIWGWRESAMSHNAGLPFAKPEHGRFIADAPWMIIQGGRRAESRIAYRVGTSKFGRNVWLLQPFGEIRIHEKIPSRRVFIEASVKRSGSAPAINQIW